MSEKEDQIEKAKALLKEHGFTLSIGGCGCCDSPWVRLAHNGRDVIFDIGKRGDCIGKKIERDNVCIDMFDDLESVPA